MEFLEAMVAERDHWKGWQHIFGPGAVLVCCGASVLANWVWGRMIGDVACSWRLSYSPAGPAFGIWLVIYPWMFASVLFQFLVNMDEDRWYCPEFGVNVLIAVSWLACSLWIWFFSLADSKNVKDGLGWAAAMLMIAAGCALTAISWERSWWFGNHVRILTVGVPYSLFAGWLVLAASLSIGTFIASQTRDADESCSYDGTDLREIRAPGVEAWVPVVLAFIGLCFSLGLSDPIVSVSVLWGLSWARANVPTWIARAVATAAVVGASVLVVTVSRL